MSAKTQQDSAPVIIKKYANRRLYNTATSSYVTLDNLSQMVREGGDFIVYDAKNGDDVSRTNAAISLAVLNIICVGVIMSVGM